MKHHQLKQGSPEWIEHRAKFKNASDTPVIMGLSKYKTRTQFMNERATGEAEQVSDAVQSRFDDGHRYEALARPVAEIIVGKDLWPVTGTDGEYGASFDGLTMNEDIAFEHKTLNDDLRDVFADIETRAPEYRENSGDLLDKMYQVQMEHQLMVSGAEQCLFMASKWDVNGNMLEEKHTWYLPNPELRKEIIDAWTQFDIDMETHQVVEVVERPQGEAVLELPALFIQATGAIIASNMKEFGEALAERMKQARSVVLTSDQDFANAKTLAKNIRDGIVQIKAAKTAMLEQTATVGETSRMIDEWAENMRLTALKLEGDVADQDKLKKRLMINEAKGSFNTIIQSLEEKVRPIRLNIAMPDFDGAIKGKSKYSSMQDSINTLTANATAEASRLASDIAEKQEYMKVVAEDCGFLFSDLQQIIFKADDDFKLLVNTRIKGHREAQEAIELAIKAQAEADARAQLEREAQAELLAQQAEAELLHQQEAEKVVVVEQVFEPVTTAPKAMLTPTQNAQIQTMQTQYFAGATPTENEMVTALSVAFKVDELVCHKWLMLADFTKYVPHKQAA